MSVWKIVAMKAVHPKPAQEKRSKGEITGASSRPAELPKSMGGRKANLVCQNPVPHCKKIDEEQDRSRKGLSRLKSQRGNEGLIHGLWYNRNGPRDF